VRVAVIGASGFIGRRLCRALAAAGHEVIAIVRRRAITHLAGATTVRYMEDAGGASDWPQLLTDVDGIIHLASPSGSSGPERIAAFNLMRDDVLTLARVAGKGETKGAKKRLVFVSTIKVNGEATQDKPFDPGSVPEPKSDYAKVKLETELGLAEISAETGLAVTVARPVAVYGPDGLGNIHLLANLFRTLPGWLVPLGGIDNQRSFIHVENLVSALTRCVEDKGSENRLFLLHDGAPISTSQLCRFILEAHGKSGTLMPDTFGIIRRISSLVAPGLARRLFGSLAVEDTGITEALGWRPSLSTQEALKQTLARPHDEQD
jgi:UDP-glucose 4-epimerase